jgi:hypothetical protein
MKVGQVPLRPRIDLCGGLSLAALERWHRLVRSGGALV